MSFWRIYRASITTFRSPMTSASLESRWHQVVNKVPSLTATSSPTMESSSKPRTRTTSLAHPSTSQSTVGGRDTPTLRPRSSTASIQSRGYDSPHLHFQNAPLDALFCSPDAGNSDILSPFPRRHHLLHQQASHWLETPSPGSTRPNSASSGHTRSQRRESISNFASLYAGEQRSSTRHSVEHSSLARRWVRWMNKIRMMPWVVPCSVLTAVGVKWATGLGSYSGV